MSRNCRRYNEGCAASLLVAGINASLAIGALTRNRGSFRTALDRIGALEEWSIGCLLVACLLVWGVIYPESRARYWSLIGASLWGASTYVSLIFLAPQLVTAPYGNTILFSAATAYALFWLHIRNETHSSHMRSSNAG